jgi:hypothetical protein
MDTSSTQAVTANLRLRYNIGPTATRELREYCERRGWSVDSRGGFVKGLSFDEPFRMN